MNWRYELNPAALRQDAGDVQNFGADTLNWEIPDRSSGRLRTGIALPAERRRYLEV